MKNLHKVFIFLFLVLGFYSQAQLSSFTLTVTKSDETCTANGILNFNVSGTVAGSTVNYSIYRLPNLTTPITVTSANSLTGLVAGNYRVVATQSLGANSASKQQDATIADLIVDLTYTLTGVDEVCVNDGSITVNVASGNAVSYEIFAGPIIRPLQTSNVFPNLTAGLYQVRVFDNCGEGVVRTFTLVHKNSALNVQLFSPSKSNCTSIQIGFKLQPLLASSVIAFPLTVTTVVNQPTGTVTIPNQIITQTEPPVAHFNVFPFFANASYTYSFQIVDRCGVVYTLSGTINLANESIADVQIVPEDCSHKQIAFGDVQSVVLTTAPTSFVPSTPVDYTPQIVNGELLIEHLPPGNYSFSIVDICGFASVINFVVENQIASPPTVEIYNVGCLGSGVIIGPITSAILLTAPAAYPNSLPFDYSDQINGGNLDIAYLPNGIYTFSIIDNCGVQSNLQVTIGYPAAPFQVSKLEGCDLAYGTVRIRGKMVSAYVVQAPSTFPHALPYDVSSLVFTSAQNDYLVLDLLPAGTYKLNAYNECNVMTEVNFGIAGYNENTNFTLIPNCGSFDIDLQHTSNNPANNNPTNNNNYYLQKYNALTNTWGHPLTGVVYPPNSLPNTSNSYQLTNMALNLNIAATGHFRILKVNTVFEPLNANAVYCYRTIKEFDFNGQPQIIRIYAVACGTSFEVIVEAVGKAPLHYKITKKNGLPFLIDNGTSSYFSGLSAAVYEFQVIDGCGNILNSSFEISSPNPLAITATDFCNGQQASLSVPNFSYLQYQWWNNNAPTQVLSTSSTLNFTSFNPATNGGTFSVQITYPGNPNSCLNQTLQFTVSPQQLNPNAGGNNSVSFCGNPGNINLNSLLSGSFDTGGSWTELTSSGMLTGTIWNATSVAPGTYVFNYRVTGYCNVFDEATVTITLKAIPQAPVINVAPVCVGGTIHLTTPSVIGAVYSWTGPNGFISSLQNPSIPNATQSNAGTYALIVTVGGCSSLVSSYSVNLQNVVSAGTGSSVSYCGSHGVVNLFGLLSGNYTSGGTWSEITTSGALIGNTWNTVGLPSGNYIFNYTVSGACNTDQEQVSVTLTSAPNTPVANAESVVCVGNAIHFTTASVSNAVYSWSGPNGFSSALQNPVISQATQSNSGEYSLVITVNDCPSVAATVVVQVANPVSAGTGINPTYCYNPGALNLFSLLSGSYATGGVWTELSSSGALTGSTWDATSLTPGSYSFKYAVAGACNTDEELLTIAFHLTPQSPVASAGNLICNGGDLMLFASTISGAAYNWSGPNGFSSTLQNPIINDVDSQNSGTYWVTVTIDGCPSAPSNVEVVVNPTPEFEVSHGCEGTVYKATVEPLNDSFVLSEVQILWEGPEDFSSTANPVVLTGNPSGTYTVSVTDTLSGCQGTVSFEVPGTTCEIPHGISPNDDGFNDFLDLSGMHIRRFEIFSRYGVKVYEKEGYVNEWRGQDYKDRLLPTGTYYYYIETEEGNAKTGWIYLSITD